MDILPEIDGVDFDRAWEKRVEGVIDTATGLTAYFISDSDLMAAKIAAGRPQDNLRRTVDPVYELWLRPYRHR